MGNPKQKWTAEEEEALRAGIAKHGTGKWKNIQQDPEFNPYLSSRSNIDLKDKWRNMSVGPGEKSRTPKPKVPVTADAVIASPVTIPQVQPSPVAPAPAPAVAPSTDVTLDEASKPPVVEAKISSKYDPMIFEAINALSCSETAVVDISAIIGFLEQRHEFPQNGRKQVTSRLRKLLLKGKLEKIQNSYRFKESKPTVAEVASPKKEVEPEELQTDCSADMMMETLEEAALAAAFRLAEAENKRFLCQEAVKEVEKLSILTEETESTLQLAQQIYDKCLQGGTVILTRDLC